MREVLLPLSLRYAFVVYTCSADFDFEMMALIFTTPLLLYRKYDKNATKYFKKFDKKESRCKDYGVFKMI